MTAFIGSDDGAHEVIGEREGDDVLRWGARRDALTLAARRWIRQHVHRGSDDMSTEIDEDLRGFNEYAKELMRKLPLEERLEDLTPEERLAGLAPEEIARALSEADRLLALPDAALRALPDAYLQTLPDETRARVRARLAT